MGKDTLSAIELKIIICVAKGYMNKDIAKELKFEIQTVKNHIWQLNKKYGFRNRVELLLAYKENPKRFMVGEVVK